MSNDIRSISECTRLLDTLVARIRTKSTQPSYSQTAIVGDIENELLDLCNQVHITLEEACNQWSAASVKHRYCSASMVLVGIHNTDDFAQKNAISTEKDQSAQVPSNRFSMSEFTWDHPFDMYVSGTIRKMLWHSSEESEEDGVREESVPGNGPFVVVDTDLVSASTSAAVIVAPVTRCSPLDRYDEFSSPTVGEYSLMFSNGIYEPLKLLEVDHKDTSPEKIYAFQYKNMKTLRACSADHMFLKAGHTSVTCPFSLLFAGHLLVTVPLIVDGVIRNMWPGSGRESEAIARQIAAMWQQQCVGQSALQKGRRGVMRMLDVARKKADDWLESGNKGAFTVTDSAPLLTTYGHTGTASQKTYSNHADAVLSSTQRAADRQCRDAFRMLEDICNVLSVMVRVHGPKLFEDDLLTQESGTAAIDSERERVDTGASSSMFASFLCTSSVLTKLTEYLNLCLGPIVETFSSLPYEISTREWCLTTCSIVRSRDAIWALASAASGVGEVETVVRQLFDSIQEMIPDRCNTAILQMTHIADSFLMDDIAREDWQSNAPYRRGRKVSAGVVALGMTYRGFLRDVLTVHHLQRDVCRYLCIGILAAAVRSVTSTYSVIAPSRVRAAQLRLDLSAALYTATATANTLQLFGVLPRGTEIETTGGGDAVADTLDPTMQLRNLQTAAMRYYFSAPRSPTPSYSMVADTINLLTNIGYFRYHTTPHVALPPSGFIISPLPDSDCTQDLEDALIELTAMTYVHTASYVEMSDMLRSCSTASHCSGTNRIASAASCSGFDKLWSVLAAPEVVSRNDVMSIDNWLQRIRLAPPLSKSCGEDDNRKASCDGAECTAYELNMTYDAIDDMEICCGNAAEPRLPIDEAKQSAVKVYCTVDAKLLRDIYVRRDWFISALRCRPEMCDSEYPPLTEEEMELAQRVMAFVASESSDGDSETILEWK